MADRKNQGLAKRVRAAEVAASITATKSDRKSLQTRVRALETARSLAATGAAKIRNTRQGIENRLRDIEAAE